VIAQVIRLGSTAFRLTGGHLFPFLGEVEKKNNKCEILFVVKAFEALSNPIVRMSHEILIKAIFIPKSISHSTGFQ